MLTPHFLRHLFQETLTFKSRDPTAVTSDGDVVLEMDFRGFLDFAMAMHASNEIASLKYYWYVVLGFRRRSRLMCSALNSHDKTFCSMHTGVF